MKKLKFDILFQSVMDELFQKAEVNYQLQSDFENQVREAFLTLPFEQQVDYVNHMFRRHWSSEDKLNALKRIALEIFGDNFEVNPVLYIEHQKQLKRLQKLNKIK